MELEEKGIVPYDTAYTGSSVSSLICDLPPNSFAADQSAAIGIDVVLQNANDNVAFRFSLHTSTGGGGTQIPSIGSDRNAGTIQGLDASTNIVNMCAYGIGNVNRNASGGERGFSARIVLFNNGYLGSNSDTIRGYYMGCGQTYTGYPIAMYGGFQGRSTTAYQARSIKFTASSGNIAFGRAYSYYMINNTA
tara:strand:- start:188 stop:763 length:576 start_codon:yes stop_codon:yes gene_type:complete